MPAPLERLTAALADRYRLERELGAGGMATVYLAADLKHDRKVAVKVLKPELAAVLGAERFVVEIKTTAGLSHPNILPLFDSGSADGFLYYVMPFIEGETLRDRLNRETQLPIDDAIRIAAEVADALDYAHRHGVIHRDIKPENILLHDGRPMVADFGIALAVSAAAGGRMTETGLSLGTPHYMSPEQATAEKEITAGSDVYSLASVLYEMLAGQPPHQGGSAQQIIMKIIAEGVKPVSEHRRTVPRHVAAALAMALAKLPADRFATARSFREALLNPGFTTTTLVGVTAGDDTRALRRLRRLLWVTGGIAAAVTVAAVWGWMRPVPPAAIARFSVLLPDSQQLATSSSGFRLAVSPDGRQLVYVGEGPFPGSSRLFLRQLSELRAVPLQGTDGGTNPAFSPDGKRLAFVAGSPRALKTISFSGGPPVTLTDSLVDAGGVAWAADGYIYYDGHLAGDGLARIREGGGSPEVATTPASTESWHSAPAALPNGRGVLFLIARARGLQPADIGVLDSRTMRHRVLRPGNGASYAESGHLLFVTDDGTLMAVRFDLDRLAAEGEAVSMADGVANRGLGRTDLALSTGGLLGYVAGATRFGNRELIWVDRDGSVTPVDTSWQGPILSRPALSPDGRAAATSMGNFPGPVQLWIKQLDRGPASKLGEGFQPSWSADGRDIVYYFDGAVWRGPADGSVLPVQTAKAGIGASPELSPDGRWLLATMSNNVVAFPTTGDSVAVPLVDGPAIERRATLSPDGRWLAYESEESGRFEVYVRPFPETRTAKRQVSVQGGLFARWSRDGRELLFVDERRDLIAVPVQSVPTFAAGIPRRLFNAEPYVSGVSGFDISLDGRRFLMTRPVGTGGAGRAELILVENFFEDLRARVTPD